MESGPPSPRRNEHALASATHIETDGASTLLVVLAVTFVRVTAAQTSVWPSCICPIYPHIIMTLHAIDTRMHL